MPRTTTECRWSLVSIDSDVLTDLSDDSNPDGVIDSKLIFKFFRIKSTHMYESDRFNYSDVIAVGNI